MALNWSAYLADDALNSATNDQWPDVSTPTTVRPLTATTTNANTADSKNQSSVRTTSVSGNISPYETRNNADAYFTDAFFPAGDYFLSDVEGLDLFADNIAGNSTSDSSPEPLSATDLLASGLFDSPRNPSGLSAIKEEGTKPGAFAPQPNVSGSITHRSQSYSGLQNDPMFASKAGFVEDLTFPNGPSGVARTTTNPLDRDTNPIVVSKEPESTTKRAHTSKPDALSACWTSPLCPNHTVDGPTPDPTTCGGACAPFLFASPENDDPATIGDQSVLANEIDVTNDLEQGDITDIVRPLKRSESESSSVPSGRQFVKNTNSRSSKMMATRLKEESASNHADDDSTSPDAQPDLSERPTAKPRRRLPHNQVERKYRESLNTQLETLRRVVPSLQPSQQQQQQQQNAQNGVDIEDLPAPSKPSKAVVLASATAYIRQMEKDKKQLADENQMLKHRIKALQALVKCEDCSLMQYVMNMKIQAPA